MTKEEILDKLDLDFPSEYEREYYTNQILQAMEQYRNEGLREELIKTWESAFDFILKYIDYEKMTHDKTLAVWHLEHLQKITDLMVKMEEQKGLPL